MRTVYVGRILPGGSQRHDLRKVKRIGKLEWVKERGDRVFNVSALQPVDSYGYS
jgi:hypothetical protein